MLLDPETLDLTGVAAQILRGGGRVKLELPAAQLEMATAPAPSVGDAIAELAAGRRELAEMAAGVARPAAAGVHPFAAPIGALNAGERYDAILADYGDVARSQQVCALQVHVAVGSADATLAVYNALRGHLPELAALAANAPFHAGRDTGLASVRPLIGGLLPRQGVPPRDPVLGGVRGDAQLDRATRVSGGGSCARTPTFGTLELRVCDAQTTRGRGRGGRGVRARAGGVAGRAARPARSWARPRRGGSPRTAGRACRSGVEGEFADLVTGERRPVRDVLRAHGRARAGRGPDRLRAELGCPRAVERNGAMRQREVGLDARGRLARRPLPQRPPPARPGT